jgi:hypothetical protein
MSLVKLSAALLGAALLVVWGAQKSFAHMDAVRLSLSQLYLSADMVVIARIESVEERNFSNNDSPVLYDVVTASISAQYKGEQLSRIEFFQDAHGQANYRSGDTAALFLQTVDDKHYLYDIGKVGGISYVSHQVGNTEHRISPRDIEDYQWVLNAFAEPPKAGASGAEQQSRKIKEILVRTLASNSQDMVESALLDWENIGHGIPLNDGDIKQMLTLTRDASKPLHLRLAILRMMSRRGLVSNDAWAYLFKHEDNENLLLVLKSTQGHESKDFMLDIVSLLNHPPDYIVEGAARALANPVYSGAEDSLKPLLESENLRLNYAAVSALLGINSQRAKALLQYAATNHPNAKVRRMISARLNLSG